MTVPAVEMGRTEIGALVGRMARELEATPPGPIPCDRCGTRRNVARLPLLQRLDGTWHEVPFCGRCATTPPQRNDGDGAGLDLLIDMAEAMKHADAPIPYVVDPIAARGFLTVLAGRPSSLKSFLMMATGDAAHRGGGEVAGMRCEPSTVVYVDAENGPRLMGRRFRDMGIPADGLLVADGTRLRLPRDLSRLRGLIKATGADLVVLDSLRKLAPGKRENESDDMAELIASIAGIARDLDVAIVLIHHRSTKPGAATLRGSSSIEDQADLVFALDRVAGDPDRQRRRLKAVKYRIDAEPDPIWLRLNVGTRIAFSAAEPYESAGGDAADGEDAAERLAERIDALADQVRRDGGWAPARLAAAVGSDQRSGTFQRAIKMLLDRGAWQSEGKTSARRLRPSDLRQSRQPYGDGVSGANQDDEEAGS
jgi:hypothetical protein